MVYRDVYASNNGKYIAALGNLDTDKDSADLTIYDAEDFSVINSLKKVPYGIGGKRCAVSDDGRYVVVSSYYNRKGIVLFDTQTGKKVWTNKAYTKIKSLKFSRDNQHIIIITQTQSIYYISMETGEKVKVLNGGDLYENIYGEDVIINGKIAKIGEIKIDCPTFAYITSITTKENVVFSPSTKGLYAYDYKNGTLAWENNPEGILHFLELKYDEANEIIYGIAPEAMISFSCVDGSIIERLNFETEQGGFSSLFIRNDSSVLGDDKKIYQLEKGKITLSDETAPFDIGYTIESYLENSQKLYGEKVKIELSDYDEEKLQLVPKNLRKLYKEYKKIVVPYLQIYSIEEALEETETTGVKEKGYFIFGYGKECGYLLCALDTNPQELFYINAMKVKETIEPIIENRQLSSFLAEINSDYSCS